MGGDRADLRGLARRLRARRPPQFRRPSWVLQRCLKRVVFSQRIEVGVAARKGAVLGVQRDRSFEVGNGLRHFSTLCVRDREHVQRVVVVGVLVAHQSKVRYRVVVASLVDGQRRGVETLIDGVGRLFLGGGLPAADIQVQPDTLVQLSFFWKSGQHRFEELLGLTVPVALERLNALLVYRDRFHISRSARRMCRSASVGGGTRRRCLGCGSG